MTYQEFLNRKNASNYLYKIEYKHNAKTILRGCNYHRVIEMLENSDLKEQVLIWLD